MTNHLTARQEQILAFIKERISEGETPTIRAIADEFGIKSPNGVCCHLGALARKGVILWIQDGRSCGIRLPGKRCRHCGGLGVVCK